MQGNWGQSLEGWLRVIAFQDQGMAFLPGYLGRGGLEDEGDKLRNRLHRKHGKGKAMGVLTHKLGRTIYYMLLRKKPFDMERFLAA